MAFILRLLSFILSPIAFFVIILPLYVYRLIVILFSKCCLPKGSEIIAPRSAMFSPCFCNMSAMGAVIAPYSFRAGLDEKEVFATWEKAAEKHKRLRCVPVMFGLFTFWKPIPEEEFSAKNHVKEIGLVDGKLSTENPPEKTTEEEFQRIKKLILCETFKKGQSPWMVYIVRNVQHPAHLEPVDVVIVKWHHGLADGLSIVKIMQGSGEDKLFHAPTTSWKGIPKLLDILSSIASIFFVLENIFCWNENYEESPVSPPASKLKRGDNFFIAESRWIPVEYIKSIKNKNGVSFNTVLLAAISHACREFVNKKKEKDQKLPKGVLIASVLPIPGHPDDELVNQWSGAVIPLPVGEPEQGVLQHINNLMKGGKGQALKVYKKMSFFGRVPFLLHWLIMPPHSLVLSDFPGPLHSVKIWGSECVDMGVALNIPPGRLGMFACTLSYNGKWKFGMTMDGAIAASQDEADEFANSVTRYIEELEMV